MLAIAAGIVDGMNLGNNSKAALVSQGCSEIRWLATKVPSLFKLTIRLILIRNNNIILSLCGILGCGIMP